MVSTKNRRAASVALVALALVGVRAAAAAGGGIGDELLVASTTTELCSSSDVRIDYDVTYVAALQGYGVSAARLSGLDERCQGYDAIVSLSGPGGALLAEGSAVVDGTEVTVVVPAETPVAADDLTGVSVVLVVAEV
ncbi:hypothetical protein Q9R32_15815 [Actinotalea sp. AC32]|nr:hypothetical protein [Actinotalea sp. AC32]